MERQPREVFAGARITKDLSEQVDLVAQRLGVSRSEVIYRSMRNGIDELDGITRVAGNPVINLALKIATKLCADDDEVREIEQQLEHLAEYRRIKRQDQLPGIES